MELTAEILSHASQLAGAIDASAVVVYADVFTDRDALARSSGVTWSVPVVYATRAADEAAGGTDAPRTVRVPGIALTRLGPLRIAILLGFARGWFASGARLVCLSGIAGSDRLDTIVVMEVGAEFEVFAAACAGDMESTVGADVFSRVLDLATALAVEGREGRPVGTAFVVGDSARVMALSRPMVLNPFAGYPEQERSVLDPGLAATIKEFSTIDGAFVIRGDGTIEAAGVYLQPSVSDIELRRGLGARHNAAAGITAATDAIAITVSESTGTVTVFRGGRIVVELEQPRPIGAWSTRRPAAIE